MKLNKPFYIDRRAGENHISLDGEWKFLWLDEATEDISSLAFKYKMRGIVTVYAGNCLVPGVTYGKTALRNS